MKRTLLLFSLTVFGMAAAEVTGKWQATAQAPGGREYPIEFSLAEEGGKLTGVISSAAGSASLEDVKWDGKELSYKVSVSEGTHVIKLMMEDGVLKGSFTSASGATGTVTARRVEVKASDLAGKWKLTVKASNGREYHADFSLAEQQGILSGSIRGEDGQTVQLKEVRMEAGQLVMKLSLNSGDYLLKLNPAPSTMTGTLSGTDGITGTLQASRT